MQKGNRHFGDRKFSRSRFDRGYIKKYKSDVQPIQLSENDVGITEYINKLDGFSGVLKARFSDFQVNEIDLDGEIAKFNCTTVPDGFDSNVATEEVIVPKDTPLDVIPQDIWDEIIAVVDNNEEKVVELDSTSFTKDQRERIHCTVKSIFRKKIVASTIQKDDKKFITFKKYNKNDISDHRFKWPYKGEYVHFLVYKENIDTLEATLKISDCLRIKPSSFTYAGVKDRRGKTTQWFSVRKVDPTRLLRKTEKLRNVHIGNITFKTKPLKLGKLIGNRFRIALRHITANDDLINTAMDNLKQNGFINYFGLQRFGNDKEVPTYEIGIKLLLGQFKEACNLILKCKTCDNPYNDISKAKKIYNDTGNAVEAAKLLKEYGNNSIESKLLSGLAKSNINDYVNALENIPRNMRLLYIHAFQALIWNKMVSQRIKEFGLKPIVGDLVLLKEDNEVLKDNDDGDDEIGDANELENSKIEKNESEEVADETGKNKRKSIKVLTEEDLENYTIYDIVLPLPGYDVTYPENTAKDWYKSILEEYNLTLEMPKQSVKTYTLSGDYRHIISQVTNLSWKIMHYDDPNDDLIRSDYDEFMNKSEPVDKADGQYKALVIDFCLQPSSYATMVVREILKTDTSVLAQTKLNNYHIKTAESKESTKVETTIDTPPPNSLLSDPAKYEDFKKSIFGSTTSSDTPKRKLEEEDEEQQQNVEKKRKEDGADEESGLKLEPALV